MKIAAIGDTHLGYPRFYKDSFTQAKAAFKDADQRADLILFLGDLYDSRVPSIQVLGETISIFRELKTPVYAIHGNHERRSRGMLNPVGLMESAGLLKHLHMDYDVFEKEGEKVFIAGMGNVPDDLAGRAIGKMGEKISPPKEMFSILMLHQSFREFVYGENLSSINALEHLGYSLYLNGHIHARKEEGNILIPGSTVLTQLTREETKPKGYVLYDTKEKTHEFIEIPSREFILEELEFEKATPSEVLEKTKQKAESVFRASPEAILKIRLKGTLGQGFRSTDLSLPRAQNLYIDNRTDEKRLKREILKLRELKENRVSIKEVSEKRLRERLEGKVSFFDPQKLFEHLLEGPEAGMQYLKMKRPKKL
ncbi:MAG: exonuclease SbcCD subunit D [Candidatus Micrarchaeia archaeon]